MSRFYFPAMVPALVFILFTDVSAQDRAPELSGVFKAIKSEVSKNCLAYPNLKSATEKIGHRLTGTEHGKKAEELAHSMLAQYGYIPEFKPFAFRNWERDSLMLEIVPFNSDNFVQVRAVTLAHSPVKANVSAGIVDAGNGLPADFERLKLNMRGKVAMLNIGCDACNETDKANNLHRSEKTALAIKYGAIGAMFVNSAPGKTLLTGTASVDGGLISIPAICISNESGRQIRAWMKDEKLMAQISMTNKSETAEARNVVAELKGSSKAKETIVIGGHLDSWDLGTGAIDNGLGSFTVLEVARVFKVLNLKPKRSISFTLFMGEEQGLYGSKALTEPMRKHPKRSSPVKYMINLDMTGDPTGFNTYGRPEAEAFFNRIGTVMKEADSTYKNYNTSEAELHSDHQPYMLEGIPVTSPNGNLPQIVNDCYHADCDVMKSVKKEWMDHNVMAVAMMLYALADADTLPATRLNQADTRKFLEQQNLKEQLILGKEWRYKD
ncbi:MAG: M28 family peptidase [Bacteroidota bacterium]